MFFNHGFSRFNGFFDHEFDEFHELGEPWRLLGNHPDGAFAKKAKNKIKKFRSHPLNPLNRSAGTCL